MSSFLLYHLPKVDHPESYLTPGFLFLLLSALLVGAFILIHREHAVLLFIPFNITNQNTRFFHPKHSDLDISLFCFSKDYGWAGLQTEIAVDGKISIYIFIKPNELLLVPAEKSFFPKEFQEFASLCIYL